MTEIAGSWGSGKTEFVLRYLGARPELRTAWLEEKLTFYPSALLDHGINPSQVLFVEADPLRTANRVLRSSIFGMVVLSDLRCGEIELRRLQILARRSNASVVLLQRELTRQGSWPIAMQLEVSRTGGSGEPLARLIKSPAPALEHRERMQQWEAMLVKQAEVV